MLLVLKNDEPLDHIFELADIAGPFVLQKALAQLNWNRRKAAVQLGVSYKTLLNKIKRTGLEHP